MKMVFSYLLILFISLSLVGCGWTDQDNNGDQGDFSTDKKPKSEVQEGDFVLLLESNKSVYQPHEQEGIFAQLKYVGNEDEIKISHGASPFSFEVTEHTRKVTIHPAQTLPLLHTTLQNDVWYEVAFAKSGEHSDDDFIQDYFNRDGFPEGEYTIEVTASFTTNDGEENEESHLLSTSIDIVVTGEDAGQDNEEIANPDIVGYVTNKRENHILVVSIEAQDFSETGGADEFYDASWVSTTHVDEEVDIGERVEVWFDGGVNESYPTQAAAKQINILESNQPKGAEMTEQEAIAQVIAQLDDADEHTAIIVKKVSFNPETLLWEIEVNDEVIQIEG
ncbi:DUF3221 domain-containing protein [Desertibacillus haloalkaliphilus]|uniref:DUF3221 domain-containing protein n=1 Tax=Desertibacillus haloalkaliphilus TaxID=1328930 RepID=UPI001C26AC43|nr:DUF3221 domain-containing protein [Desertibacillus haloalkaliphilus]MBU8907691.1 YobA family protein [Desertibacillus haloalkaliphilus]